MEQEIIELENGLKTTLYKWEVKQPIAIMQMVHGSKERAIRYDGMAKYLNEKGVSVVSVDLRGHGEMAFKQGHFGDMGEEAAVKILEDIHKISQMISYENPKVKYVMYGHSMGSFALRNYVVKYRDADGYIFSGTNQESKLTLQVARLIVWFTKLFKGKTNNNVLIDKMSYQAFDKQLAKEGLTGNWMAKKPATQKAYLKDKFNAFKFSNNSFAAMLKWNKQMVTKAFAKGTHKKPLMFISGEKDPVGNMGKGPEKANSMYRDLGYDTQSIIYKDLRHEIHNEEENKDVYKDILKFIKKV